MAKLILKRFHVICGTPHKRSTVKRKVYLEEKVEEVTKTTIDNLVEYLKFLNIAEKYMHLILTVEQDKKFPDDTPLATILINGDSVLLIPTGGYNELSS